MNASRALPALLATLVLGLAVVPAGADTVESAISVYSGENAKNYVRPLHEAVGVTLNSGMFYTARIPTDRFKIALELPVMGVLFGDDDKTFQATPEGPFIPATPSDASAQASTIIGPTASTSVDGQGGTTFSFPGGFDLGSFGLTVPQLRVSAKGTELIARALVGIESGDIDIGDVRLYGGGIRHNIDQHFDGSPVNLAAIVFYQTLRLGKNVAEDPLVSVDALNFGFHASKDFPFSFMKLTPYGGVTFDSFQTDIDYQTAANSSTTQKISYDRENSIHFTVGAGLNLVAAQVFAQYDYSLRSSFVLGVALGNLGS